MSHRAEKQFGNILLRTCHSVGEFRQALDLQREVWNFNETELVPVRLFVVGEKIGGHIIGAFDGNDMVGFVYGIPGYRGGHSYIHSHMLAVGETHRNTGLGRALKLFQRELAIEQGFELVEWTFDPLEIKNAHLNIERLGAIARRYSINQYGITTSPLQGGLPTDRLTAEWWLNSERVLRVLEAGDKPPVIPKTVIDVPEEIYRLKSDPSGRSRAAEIQTRIRDQFMAAFGQGLAVLGYERDEKGNGRFLLTRWNENWNYFEATHA